MDKQNTMACDGLFKGARSTISMLFGVTLFVDTNTISDAAH